MQVEEIEELSGFTFHIDSSTDRQYHEGFVQLVKATDTLGGDNSIKFKIYKFTFIRWRTQRTYVASLWTSTLDSVHQDGDPM